MVSIPQTPPETSYTSDANPEKEEAVHNRLVAVVDEILKHMRPDAILLAGAFGRGEGTVLELSGEWVPIKDFDIILVARSKLSNKQISNLKTQINLRIGLPELPFQSLVPMGFEVSLIQVTPRELMSFVDIKTFEICSGSKLLYGRDPRPGIRFTREDIPSSSGARLLFNKAVGLNSIVDDSIPSGQKMVYYVHECMKTYLEMASAWLVLERRFVPGFQARLAAIRERPVTYPLLLEDVEKYTTLKIHGTYNDYLEVFTDELWFKTQQDFLRFLVDFFSRSFYLQESDPVRFCDALLDKLKKRYFKDSITRFFEIRFGNSLPLWARIANRFYQLWAAARYFVYARRNGVQVPASSLFHFPPFHIYISAILLLFARKSDGTIDSKSLLEAQHQLSNVIICDDATNSLESWYKVRECLLRALRLYDQTGGLR